MKKQAENNTPAAQDTDKDMLTQQNIKDNKKNIPQKGSVHKALETDDGKNNGAEPAVFANERKYHP